MRKIDIISQLNILLVKEFSNDDTDNIVLQLENDDLLIKRSTIYVSDKRMDYDTYALMLMQGVTLGEPVHNVAVRNNNTIELARFILDKLGKKTTMQLLELNAGE